MIFVINNIVSTNNVNKKIVIKIYKRYHFLWAGKYFQILHRISLFDILDLKILLVFVYTKSVCLEMVTFVSFLKHYNFYNCR